MPELAANKSQVIQFTKPGGTPRRWAGAWWNDTGDSETTLDANITTITDEAGEANELVEAATAGEPPGNKTVLVVDDEPMVREAIAQILRRSGYRVLEASGAVEARRLTQNSESINLLLTDFSMPDTNGLELARWFQHEYPEKKVLIATASSWELANQVGEHEQIPVLPKPFDGFQLDQMLRLILG